MLHTGHSEHHQQNQGELWEYGASFSGNTISIIQIVHRPSFLYKILLGLKHTLLTLAKVDNCVLRVTVNFHTSRPPQKKTFRFFMETIAIQIHQGDSLPKDILST